MTTIAYNHKAQTISIDGQVTEGGEIVCNSEKKYKVMDGYTSFLAGDVNDWDLLLSIYEGHADTDDVPNCSCLIIEHESNIVYGVYVDNNGKLYKEVTTYDYCIGSGRRFAIAALDMGKSSADAVAYASTRCIYTNNYVTTYDIKSATFDGLNELGF